LRRVASKDDTTGGKGKALDAKPYHNKFIEAMDDDFNTPQAIATLFDLSRDINRAEETGINAGKARATLKELGGILGLTFKAPEGPSLDTIKYHGEIISTQTLIDERNRLRKAKRWQEADKIRDELASQGIVLEDSPDGKTVTIRMRRK
jgi:cysteinyl-tRNA synthetase